MKKVITIAVLLVILINAIILPCQTMLQTTALLQNTQKRIYYHDILNHVYCVTCLTRSTNILSHLYKQNYQYKPCNIHVYENYIQIDAAIFSHPHLRACIKKMVETETLQPLLVLIKKIKQYNIIHDQTFFHEFFVLIFTIYKQILFNECAKEHHPIKKSTLDTIITITNIINQLPIAEVLSAIEMLVVELPPFFEKYELNSRITWKKWLKKYWWVPPIFGIWFGLKILLKLQRPYFFYTPYYSSPFAPRPQIPLDQPIIAPLEPIITDPVLLEIR